ncbi:hypothetical protein [Agromyces sp. H66]|uniref:hypothetical protein n=1 Tax=Agromyces sp. H66 TaxID=2529859 RepID=UPI0010AA2654|nr:hypothetical protein [Agromyces sp. H66]
MSETVTADISRARASIAFGREHGYYRVLFEAGPVDAAGFAELAGVSEHHARAWLDEQVEAGVLRAVAAPSGDREELLLPGEHVPILLGDRGGHELDGARELLDEHRDELPAVLGAEHEHRRVRAFADHARLMRVV